MNATAVRNTTTEFWLNLVEPAIMEAALKGRASVFVSLPVRNAVLELRLRMPTFVRTHLTEQGFSIENGVGLEGVHICW